MRDADHLGSPKHLGPDALSEGVLDSFTEFAPEPRQHRMSASSDTKITNAFALLRLLPGSDRDKDAELLALRHQLAVVLHG
jgi:hypothetical protein